MEAKIAKCRFHTGWRTMPEICYCNSRSGDTAQCLPRGDGFLAMSSSQQAGEAERWSAAHQQQPDAVDVLVEGGAEALVVVGREHVVHLLCISRA